MSSKNTATSWEKLYIQKKVIFDVYTWQHFVPGARDSPHIIGGSSLLVHNRGKNSDLDEWLKDVAEVRLSLLLFLCWSLDS